VPSMAWAGPLFASRRESGAPGVAVARPARGAAAALLRSGGPSAVTIDAVTRAAHVARATLYRHVPSGNDLLAAAFNSFIPASPMPLEEGSLRDRLIASGLAQAEFVPEAPSVLIAMS
jgi:AcrR family transcriptional regulator